MKTKRALLQDVPGLGAVPMRGARMGKVDQGQPPRRRKFRSWSLAARLTLLYTVTAASLLAMINFVLFQVLRDSLQNEHEHFLSDHIHLIRRILDEHPDNMDMLRVEIEWKGLNREFNQYYSRLLDDRGHTLLETPGMGQVLPPSRFPQQFPGGGGSQESIEQKVGKHGKYRVMAAQVNIVGRPGERRVIQVALEWSAESQLLKNYRRQLIYAWAIGLIFSAMMSYLVTRRGMGPVREMTQVAQKVQASNLHERIASTGWPAELTALAVTFDAMLDRLEESFSRLSRFSADIAHELRTPLNNLRGEAEVALSRERDGEGYRQVLESSLEEFERLARMIDNLLFLSRAENADLQIECSVLDARHEAEAVADFYEALASEQNVQIVCEGQAQVFAAPLLLRRVLSNLLSNALQYTPMDGKVVLHIAQAENGATRLIVSDTGCGIEAAHLPHIFDRFFRADPARSHYAQGTGLGLAIVKSIMELHGGSITVQSRIAQGTQFTLEFPAAPATSTE